MSPALNNPLMPPIFFTTAANFVYCVIKSFTSFSVTPDPCATLTILPGCLLNNFAPSLLSNSKKRNNQFNIPLV